MNLPDELFKKLDNIQQKIWNGKYRVYRVCEPCGFDYRYNYEIFMNNKYSLLLKTFQSACTDQNGASIPQLVGKFYWLRRWKNVYEPEMREVFVAELYNDQKYIGQSNATTEQEHFAKILYNTCRCVIEESIQKTRMQQKLKEEKIKAEEKKRIEKYLRTI